jgi:hypothetical protein
MPLFVTEAPSAKFPTVGTTVEGEVTDVYRAQRFEYVKNGQGLPLYWQNRKPTAGARFAADGTPNDPVLQEVITLDTGVPDANGDTERRIFIKNKRMRTAIAAAVAAAGGRRAGGLLLGGRLSCTWVGEEEGEGGQPAKVYEFTYTPPAPGTGRTPDNDVRLSERSADTPAPVTPPVPDAAPEPATAYAPAERAPIPGLDNHKSSPVLNPRPRSTTPAQALGIPDEPPF